MSKANPWELAARERKVQAIVAELDRAFDEQDTTDAATRFAVVATMDAAAWRTAAGAARVRELSTTSIAWVLNVYRDRVDAVQAAPAREEVAMPF